ncbi:MAG: CoA transferase [Chloroflexi bacterium]|nr:CoA transferase [Chloroflexota bacterium]
MLDGFRVLDLTDEKGFLCGRLMADLGADVIKIEPPGGDPSRGIGPFYKDIPHSEKSLYWFVYNANKRGITLNIASKDGQNIFKKLVKKAHFVIESFSPGYMKSLGLGYAKLSKINPEIILTSITPFGQTGPYSHYKASDIVEMGLCGLLYLCGDSDRSPVRISFPQAYLHAGAEAVVGTMVAHYHRGQTGEGQWVDVSIQEATYLATMNAPLFWTLENRVLKRAGAWRTGITSGILQRQIWPCKDGYVNMPVYGGDLGAKTNRALTQWMRSEGMADDFLASIDWNKFDMATVSQETWNHIEQLMVNFFKSHTKQELYLKGLTLGVMIYPLYTPEDIAKDKQLGERGYWTPIEHPELGETLTYPGVAVKASLTPLQIKRRAPLIGEHNREIYQELGFTKEEMVSLVEGGVI